MQLFKTAFLEGKPSRNPLVCGSNPVLQSSPSKMLCWNTQVFQNLCLWLPSIEQEDNQNQTFHVTTKDFYKGKSSLKQQWEVANPFPIKLCINHSSQKWPFFFTRHGYFSLCLIQKQQRCYPPIAISNLDLIFISREENNWMSHLLTQFHSANYSSVIFFFFFSLHHCILNRINKVTGEIILKTIDHIHTVTTPSISLQKKSSI